MCSDAPRAKKCKCGKSPTIFDMENVVDDGVHFPVFIINVFSYRAATTFQSACYFCLVSVCFNEHVWNGFY
jgi:hypothetical protein